MKPKFKRRDVTNSQTIPLDQNQSMISMEEISSLLVIKPSFPDVDLAEWIKSNMKLIEDKLSRHGGVLFRGFNVQNENHFNHLINSSSNDLLNYIERTTPRTQTSDNVYTSTEFPSDQTIAMHNELSYSVNSPKKLWFYCLTPAAVGGETPVADGRKVLQSIPEEIIEKFKEKGWKLERNYGNGFGLSWQEAFNTTEKAVVENYCLENDIDFRWKEDDRLQTMQIRKAIRKHEVTNELVWFNHVAFYHQSNLTKSIRDTLIQNFGKENLPFNTYYGDGSVIDDVTIYKINSAYDKEMIVFPWEKKDVLMLDNMLMSHGRKPFEGPRKILVAMGN